MVSERITSSSSFCFVFYCHLRCSPFCLKLPLAQWETFCKQEQGDSSLCQEAWLSEQSHVRMAALMDPIGKLAFFLLCSESHIPPFSQRALHPYLSIYLFSKALKLIQGFLSYCKSLPWSHIQHKLLFRIPFFLHNIPYLLNFHYFYILPLTPNAFPSNFQSYHFSECTYISIPNKVSVTSSSHYFQSLFCFASSSS